MKALGLIFLLLLAISTPSTARAEIMVAATLEWLADHCRESGIYKVQSVEKKEHLTNSYEVSFSLERELRGNPARTVADAYYPGKYVHAGRPSVRVGDEFLICFQHYTTGEVRPVQLINLTNPGLGFPKFIAVSSNLELLRRKADILEVFFTRLRSHAQGKPVEISDYSRDNRVELPFGAEVFSAVYGGSTCYLRVPEDLLPDAKRAAAVESLPPPPAARFSSEMYPSKLPKYDEDQPAVVDHAIHAELGKFLLVRHGRRLVALRVLKHLQHTTASGKGVTGAMVEYYLSTSGNFADRQRSEVEVAEDYEDQKFLYVHIPGLVMEWSSNDWFYAPGGKGERITVARTDWDTVDDVDFADSDLIWFYLRKQSHPPEPPLHKLLVEYRGEVKLPDDLYAVYAHLVEAIESGDRDAIEQYCLPEAVTFTTDIRPEQTREYGQDMNLPFLKRGFHKYILNLRKDSDQSYLIRTGSSYLFFVRVHSTGWKLYRYGDKPIQ